MIKKAVLWVLGSSENDFYRIQPAAVESLLRLTFMISKHFREPWPFQEHGCEMEIICTYKFYLHNTRTVQRSHS